MSQERKATVLDMVLLATWKQQKTFLGMTGFCGIWIPNLGIIAKPLYEFTVGLESECLEWTREIKGALRDIKQALVLAPALGSPDIRKTFTFYVAKKQVVTHRGV